MARSRAHYGCVRIDLTRNAARVVIFLAGLRSNLARSFVRYCRAGCKGGSGFARDAARVLRAVNRAGVRYRAAVCDRRGGLAHDTAGIVPARAGSSDLRFIRAAVDRRRGVARDTAEIRRATRDRARGLVRAVRNGARRIARDTAHHRAGNRERAGSSAARRSNRAVIRYAGDRVARAPLTAHDTAHVIAAARNGSVIRYVLHRHRNVGYRTDNAAHGNGTGNRSVRRCAARAGKSHRRCRRTYNAARVIAAADGCRFVTDVRKGGCRRRLTDNTAHVIARTGNVLIRRRRSRFAGNGKRMTGITNDTAHVICAADRARIKGCGIIGKRHRAVRGVNITDDTAHALTRCVYGSRIRASRHRKGVVCVVLDVTHDTARIIRSVNGLSGFIFAIRDRGRSSVRPNASDNTARSRHTISRGTDIRFVRAADVRSRARIMEHAYDTARSF